MAAGTELREDAVAGPHPSPEERGFRTDIAEAALIHDYESWRFASLVYADWLEEHGQEDKGRRRREYAARRMPPGLLWPKPRHVSGINPHQKETLAKALCGPIVILAGSPGTGKTFTTARLVDAIFSMPARRRVRKSVAVCAPTGKAAVRITEALRNAGLTLHATTIHSMLGVGRNGHDGQGWAFQYNEENKLGYQYVIVDEASMLDTTLANSLFSALKPGTHVLLVGDPDQLPPVGHGAVLRDLIKAGMPCGRLTEIQRNAGAIVEACAAIRDGKTFRLATETEQQKSGNLWLIDARTPLEQVEALKDMLGSLKESGADTVKDVQILVATNEKTPVSRRELNRMLQGMLNPVAYEGEEGEEDQAVADAYDDELCQYDTEDVHKESQAGGNKKTAYRLNDKVICLRNHIAPSPTSSRQGHWLANGEIGEITEIEGQTVTALFPDPDRYVLIQTPRPKGEGDDRLGGGDAAAAGASDAKGDFDLAYAITAHKSQGSEWPFVIVMVDASFAAKGICCREWVYTAISRAKKLCVLIGRESVLRMMCRRTALENRKTFLTELLREELAK